MSYSEELYNNIVANAALTNESSYDEFMANLQDPSNLQKAYMKAKFIDPFNTPSTIDEFSELLKKKEEDGSDVSTPQLDAGQDTPSQTTEETSSDTSNQDDLSVSQVQVPQFAGLNIAMPKQAVGASPIAGEQNTDEKINPGNPVTPLDGVEEKDSQPVDKNWSAISTAKKVQSWYKNNFASHLAEAEDESEGDGEVDLQVEDDSSGRKKKRNATKQDVKEATQNLYGQGEKITYRDAIRAFGDTQILGVKVNDKDGTYSMIWHNTQEKNKGIGQEYKGTIGDKTWQTYVDAQREYVNEYTDDNAWEDLKTATQEAANANEFESNYQKHTEKYNLSPSVTKVLKPVEVKSEEEKPKSVLAKAQEFVEKTTAYSRVLAKKMREDKKEKEEWDKAVEISKATAYVKEIDNDFYSDLENTPTTQSVASTLGIDVNDLITGNNKFENIVSLTEYVRNSGTDVEDPIAEAKKIYDDMARDARYHLAKKYIEHQIEIGTPGYKVEQLDRLRIIKERKLDMIDPSSVGSGTDIQSDANFGASVFSSSMNDYLSHYSATGAIHSKNIESKGITRRAEILTNRAKEIGENLIAEKGKQKFASEEEVKTAQENISNAVSQVDELNKQFESLIVEENGEKFYKDEESMAKGKELEAQIEAIQESIKGDQALLEKVNKSAEKWNSKVENVNKRVGRLKSVAENIIDSDEDVSKLRELNHKLEGVQLYNDVKEAREKDEYGNEKPTYGDSEYQDNYFSGVRKYNYDADYKARKEAEASENNFFAPGGFTPNAVQSFTKGVAGGIASAAVGISTTGQYFRPSWWFDDPNKWESQDVEKEMLGQLNENISYWQSNPYYSEWGLNWWLNGLGSVVPDLAAVALTGGGAGFAEIAASRGVMRGLGKVATSGTTTYFTMRSAGNYAMELEKAGYSPLEAMAGGSMIAQVESMLESMFPEFGSSERVAIKSNWRAITQAGMREGKSVNIIAKEMLDSFVKSAYKTGKNAMIQGFQEKVEEISQGIFSGLAMSKLKGEEYEIIDFKNGQLGKDGKDLLHQGAIALATGTIMGGAHSIRSWVRDSQVDARAKLVQLTIGQDYESIANEIKKTNEDFDKTPEGIEYKEISEAYKKMALNPKFNEFDDVARAEILNIAIGLDKDIKSQKEMEKMGVVDVELDKKIEDTKDALAKTMESANNTLKERNALNEKLNALGVKKYQVNMTGKVTDIEMDESLAEDKMATNLQDAVTQIQEFYKPKPRENAVQKSSTGEVLQREPQEAGEAGSQRQGVEPSVEGQEPTQKSGTQKIEEQPLGDFEEVTGPNTVGGVEEGYRKNVLWGSKNFAESGLVQFAKKELEKGKKLWMYLVKPSGKETVADDNHAKMMDAGSALLDLYRGGEGKNDQKYIENAKAAGLSDEAISKIIEISQKEDGGTKEDAHKKWAEVENIIGSEIKSSGVSVQQASSANPSQVRIYGKEGNKLTGVVEMTPEIVEKLNDPNLSEQEKRGIISELTGVEVDENTLMHLNTTSPQRYNEINGTSIGEDQKVNKATEVSDEQFQTALQEAETIGADVNALQSTNREGTKSRVLSQIVKGVKTLKSVFPNMKIVVHENTNDYNKAMELVGGNKNTRGQFIYKKQADGSVAGAIHINLEKANRRTVSHEIGHAVLLKVFGENPKLFNTFRSKMSELAKGQKVRFIDQNGQEQEASWDDIAGSLADRYSDDEKGEEYIAELTGLVSELDANDNETKSVLRKIADFINNFISKFSGMNTIDDTSSAEEILDFFKTLGEKIGRGEKIKSFDDINSLGLSGVINVTDNVRSKSSIDSGEIKRFPVNKNTKVSEGVPLKKFDGKTVNLMESDRMTGGYISDSEGNPLFKFYGGVFYPIITGKWWASRNKTKAKVLAENANKNRDKDGYVYSAPMIGSDKQHMSNTDMLNVTVELMKFDANSKTSKVKKTDVISYIDKAFSNKSVQGKRAVVKTVLKKSNSINDLFNELEFVLFQEGDKILDKNGKAILDENKKPISNFTFEERLAIVNSLLGDPKVKEARFPSAGSISEAAKRFEEPITAKVENIGDLVTIMRTKGTLVNRTSDVNDEFYHKSYPEEIYAVNEDGSPAEIEVYVLDGAYSMKDVLPSLTQSKGEEFTWDEYLKRHKSEKLAISQYNRTAKLSSASGKIKSGVRVKSQKLSDKVNSFFDEIETVFPNDDIRGGYAVTNEKGSYIGRVSLSPIDENTVKIDEVVSKNYGQKTGNGTAIMKMVTSIADNHNVALKLTPNLILSLKAKGFETPDKLKSFYEKFGFEKDSKLATMTRQPKGGVVAKSQIDIDAEDSPLYKQRSKEDVPFVSNERVRNDVPKMDATTRKTEAKNIKIKPGMLVGSRLNINATNSLKYPVLTIHYTHGTGSSKENPNAYKGEAIGQRGNITLSNVNFNISQSGRERIASGTETKHVMAMAVGNVVDVEPNFDGIELSFNPAREHLFVDSEGRAVKSAEEVTLMGYKAYARGKISYYEENEDPRKANQNAPSRVKFAKTKEELVNTANALRSGEVTPQDLGVKDVDPNSMADALEAVADGLESGGDVSVVINSAAGKITKLTPDGKPKKETPNETKEEKAKQQKEKVEDVEVALAKIIAGYVKSRMDTEGTASGDALQQGVTDFIGNEEDASNLINFYKGMREKILVEVNKMRKKEAAQRRKEMSPEAKNLQETIKREAQAALEGFKAGRKEGKAEGTQQGLERGQKQGFKEGVKEGKVEGQEKGRKEGITAGRKVGAFEGFFKGLKRAESTQRSVAKAVSEVINALQKTSKISDAVARQLVKRAVGITTEQELTDYMNFVSEVLVNNEIATALSEIKKLQRDALKKRTYQHSTMIRQFAKMPLFKNKKLLFDFETLEAYRNALKAIVDNKVPDLTKMNQMMLSGNTLFEEMFQTAMISKPAIDVDKAEEIVKAILNDVYFNRNNPQKPFEIKTFEDYLAFKRKMSSLKNALGQMLLKNKITEDQYNDVMAKFSDIDSKYGEYESFYQDQIDDLKNKTLNALFDNSFVPSLIDDVIDEMNNNPSSFTEPQRELLKQLASMSASDFADSSVEDIEVLKDVVYGAMQGFVAEAELRDVMNRARVRSKNLGQGLINQLQSVFKRFTKGNIGVKIVRQLLTQDVVFWESLLGLKENGVFWRNISQPLTRAYTQYKELVNKSLNEFLSDTNGIKFKGDKTITKRDASDPLADNGKVKISNETYSKVKIGVIGHILDNAWKKVNTPGSSEENMKDWLGDILGNVVKSSKFNDGGDYTYSIVRDIYEKLAKAYPNEEGGINHEAILRAYEKGGNSRNNLLNSEEQEYYEALRTQFSKTAEYVFAANSQRNQKGENNPYYMPRVYFGNTSGAGFETNTGADKGGTKARVRSSASFERTASVPNEAMQFNVDNLLYNHVDDVYFDYSITTAKSEIKAVLDNAKLFAEEPHEKILLNEIRNLIDARLDSAEQQETGWGALSKPAQLFVTNALIGVKRTPVEFTNNLIVYSLGNKSAKAVTLPFSQQKTKEVDAIMKRFNSSVEEDAPKRQVLFGKSMLKKLKGGKYDASIRREAAIKMMYPILNNTTYWMRKGEWMTNFENAFKELTGEKFIYDKHFNNANYTEAMNEAANTADFNMRRIMKGGNKSEQSQYIKFPEPLLKVIAKLSGKDLSKKQYQKFGMISKNEFLGAMMGLFNNFIAHDVSNIEIGLRDKVFAKRDVVDGIKQASGAMFRLALYPTLLTITQALIDKAFGAPDKKKEADELLQAMTTPEGWVDVAIASAESIASAYVSGKFGNVAKLVSSTLFDIAYSNTSDPVKRKLIKQYMNDIYFTNPIDFEEKKGELRKEYITRMSDILTPMISMVTKEFEKTMDDLYNKTPDEKVTVADLYEYMASDQKGKDVIELANGLLLLTQGVMSGMGLPIPFVDDYVRIANESLKADAINNVDSRTTIKTPSGEIVDMLDLLLDDDGMVDINTPGLTSDERDEVSQLATEKLYQKIQATYGDKSQDYESVRNNAPGYDDAAKQKYANLRYLHELSKLEALKESGFNTLEWDQEDEIVRDKKVELRDFTKNLDKLDEDILKSKHKNKSEQFRGKDEIDSYILENIGNEEFKKYGSSIAVKSAIREYLTADFNYKKYQVGSKPDIKNYLTLRNGKYVVANHIPTEDEKEMLKEKNQNE